MKLNNFKKIKTEDLKIVISEEIKKAIVKITGIEVFVFYDMKLYPVKYENTKFKTLYSNSNNNKYSLFTKKIYKKAIDFNKIVFKFWTPVKHNQKVKGYIKDKYFYIKI